jgi:hypothetical protein
MIRTHELTPLVVGASSGSLTMMPEPKTFLFNEWLIMYMWSSVLRGPAIRSTEHGKEASVTLKGVSQTYNNHTQVNSSRNKVERRYYHLKLGKNVRHATVCVGASVEEDHYPLAHTDQFS